MTGMKFAFDRLTVLRHGKTEYPVNKRAKNIPFDRITYPFGIGRSRLDYTQKIKQTDDQNQCGILEEAYKVAHYTWDYMF